MGSLISSLTERLTTVLNQIITLDSVIIIACIWTMVKLCKESAKSLWRRLENWEYRALSILFGVLFAYAWLDLSNYKHSFIYGIFYGGVVTGVIWFWKEKLKARILK
jgi:hypothetical protein